MVKRIAVVKALIYFCKCIFLHALPLGRNRRAVLLRQNM